MNSKLPYGYGLVRILNTLLTEGDLNISKLALTTGLGYELTRKNVNKLMKMGLVKEFMRGNSVIITTTFIKMEITFKTNQKMHVEIIPK